MTRLLGLTLGIALVFSLMNPFPFSSWGASGACAQSTAPVPKKPAKIKITFKGGPGDTPATAVVISGAPNSRVGIDAEYYYLNKKFGKPKVDWKLKRQSVLHLNNKIYDKMELELKSGSKMTIFFDITEFFGKL